MIQVVGSVWQDKLAQLASDINAWQTQVNAAGGSAKVDTSQVKSQAGSDAFKTAVAAAQAAGQSAAMAAQNATNIANQVSMMNLPPMQAPSSSPNAVTSVAQLQQLAQAAQAAGQAASSAAGTGAAMPVGADATSWMQQAQQAVDAANAAAQAANQGAQQLQLVAQLAQQAGAGAGAAGAAGGGAGGGGFSGGGGAGGGGGGGGIDESQVDWGDGEQGGGGGGGGGGGMDDYTAAQQMTDEAASYAPSASYDMNQAAFDAGEYPFPQDLDFSDVQGILGAQVIGMIDIAAKQQQMNSIKTVPLSVARELLKGGQAAIDRARELAAEYDLPGGGARDNVYWKLKWHEDALSKQTGSNATLYAPGEDLKKWVMQAFIEGNAAEEGANQQALVFGKIWTDMWNDVAVAVAALPAVVKQAVSSVAHAAEGVESTVKWTSGLLVGGTVILGAGVLYALYKIIVSDTGKEIARTATGVALGRRY